MNQTLMMLMSVAGIALAAVAGLVCLRLNGLLSKQRETVARQEAEIQALRSDLGALVAGAKGVGERLNKLEHLLRHQAERQDQLELRSTGERPYQQAIRMVHKGAGARELVEAFGMTRSEADLIVMMHQVDKAG